MASSQFKPQRRAAIQPQQSVRRPHLSLSRALAASLVVGAALCGVGARADCECGYRTASGDVWTDALVLPSWTDVDLVKAPDFFLANWQREPTAGEPYGVLMNIQNAAVQSDGSLGLTVRSAPVGNKISSAGVMTVRKDILFGTFRVFMQGTPVPGTLAAFEFTGEQENAIDMQVFSRTASQSLLTMYQRKAVLPDPMAQQIADMGSNPANAYHEYRFDWLPTRTDFYVDSQFLTSLYKDPPTQPGSILISHWADGLTSYTGARPTTDATVSVNAVRYFFNTSDTAKKTTFDRRCAAAIRLGRQRAVCDIDSVTGSVTSSNDPAALDPTGGGQQGLPDLAKYALLAMAGLALLVILTVGLSFPARYIMATKRQKALAARREKVSRSQTDTPASPGVPGRASSAASSYAGYYTSDEGSDAGSVGTGYSSKYSAPPNFNAPPKKPALVERFMADARRVRAPGLRERASVEYNSDGSTMMGEDDERSVGR